MKKITLSIIFLFLVESSSLTHIRHYENYNYLEYELFRNNNLIGKHIYKFERNSGNLTVNSEVSFQIKKFNIILYKYYAKSQELYKNGKFFGFVANTLQNKKEKYVNISVDSAKKRLLIDGSSYKGPTSLEAIVGTWWNHEIVKAKAQISAVSGRIIEQKVTFLGKETVKINGKSYEALHFNFSSSDENLPDNKKLNTDIWYDEKTKLWIKASFDKTGFWEYRLKVVK